MKETLEYPEREKSEHNLQHADFHYRTGRWQMTGFEDKAQPLDVSCRKCRLAALKFPSVRIRGVLVVYQNNKSRKLITIHE